MPEISIPGMAFKARLTKKQGSNVVELIFRDEVVTTVDIGERVTEESIITALNIACKEADIEHQVPKALLAQVAGDLYKAAGLAEGKELVPEEFEVSGDASEIDRRLALIIDSLQTINTRLDKIESLLKSKLT
ncbi:MAG: hypothetical protein ACXACP_07290 [Candidatus Hodarchaeales archaeon]|jgi:hypothetical protein